MSKTLCKVNFININPMRHIKILICMIAVSTFSQNLAKAEDAVAVLFGDSLTECWPSRGREAFFTENRYSCQGVSGETTFDLLDRVGRVLALNPKVVVIGAGTNDMAENDGYHRELDYIVANMSEMVDIFSGRGIKVIIASALPASHIGWRSAEWNGKYDISSQIVRYNAMLRKLAEAKSCLYADYYTLMNDGRGGLKKEYMWQGTDAVHPGYEGYAVMEKVLQPLVQSLL